MDPTTLYVLLILFFATVIRSAFGFGEALVAVPLLALKIPVTTAAPLAVAVSVLVAAVIVLQDFRHIHFRSAAGLVAASLLGIPLGLLILATTNDTLIKLALGILIIAFAAWRLLAGGSLQLRNEHPALLLTCGFIAGILGGAYGMNGPPLAIYGALRRWSPQHFRATLQAYFLPASALGLLGYVLAGLWSPAITRYLVLSLPLILLAILLGRLINRRLRGDSFTRYLYVGLILIGAILLIQATDHRNGVW